MLSTLFLGEHTMLQNAERFLPAHLHELTDPHFPFDFYLTGSRFWGNAKEDSDWDFYTLNTPDVQRYLEKICEFKLAQAAEYGEDTTITRVYEKGVGADKIQVQLVTNVEHKTAVQYLLKELYPDGFASKEQAKAAWKLALVCYGRGVYNSYQKARKEFQSKRL